jgi:hypothetical protein
VCVPECPSTSCSYTNTAIFFLSEPARAITERVLSLPAFRECNSISCYLSMESGEAKTLAIVDAIFQSSEHSHTFVTSLSSSIMKDLLKISFNKR